MRRIFFLCLLAIRSLPVIAQTIPETIDELLKAHARQFSFNGSVLVAQKGTVLLQKGYGYKNVKLGAKNDGNTIFQVGSLTKQFTAVIILQLAEKKLLSLQDRLSKYIPGYPNGDSISIENLLNHTSGIYNYTSDTGFMQYKALKPVGTEEIIALFKNKPLAFNPGTKYSYTNSGYILLGFIIEKITGSSYFKVVNENILRPLRMDHSGFNFAALVNSNKATGYTLLTATKNRTAGIVDSSVSYASGALYTTVGDLYKWDQSLYKHTIISDSSIQKAFTPNKFKYGYGWVIDSTNGKKLEMHEGDTYGFTGFFARIPADSTCIILLDNRQSSGLTKIAQDINAILNNDPFDFPKLHTEIEPDTAIVKQYVGEYQLGAAFILSISLEDGQLKAAATGQGKVDIYEEKADHFFFKMVNARIEFFRDADGKVTRMILYQDDREFPGKKIK